ncbi:Retrovirus-related Pol polyprotein from type-1 retrotransposable element R2 [Toxocara canis]|uniref:Retrovirus-related Pol polyprotein from type-1 retrotransposable element R2 n=1 Tax=Toxocara canis TaxID=6265 RepID=A0A0B2UXT6_TOXCA|nr:Retrovirus-related Pol polyprotein from type-1 retrotransposable element R2 [Toxocara canis]
MSAITVYKVSRRVIYKRIESTLDESTRREQAGFRKRFPTIDHIFDLTQIKERRREYKVPLCLLFIDFKQAFGSVEHNSVLQSLSDGEVGPVFIRIMEDSLSESHTEITLFETSVSIKIGRGVKQGEICSSKAFSLALEGALRKMETADGFNVDGEKLQVLRFANDTILVAGDPEKLQRLLNEFNNKAKEIGLSIHDGKTK